MKHKKLFFLLLAAAAVLTVLMVILKKTGVYSSESVFQLFTFPFLPLYKLLGGLSQGGGIKSGLALALWILFCVLPLIPAVTIRGKQEVLAERLIWCAVAVLMGLVPVNGFNLTGSRSAVFDGMEQLLYCLLIWSLIIAAAVLYLIRLFKKGDTIKLYGYLKKFLIVLAFFIVGRLVFMIVFSNLVFHDYRLIYLLLMVILILVPDLLELMVIFAALSLTDAVLSEKQDMIRTASEHLSNISCKALGVTAVLCPVIEFLLIIMIRKMENVSINFNMLPITQLLFVLMALLFSRLVTENRELKDDNNLFI